ncbi:MAG: DUF5060 domain-containing protein, partial [Lentisphaeria bacterium]|nr:DUF5060 domain-containing protein [Lentisphaeria bacterium]
TLCTVQDVRTPERDLFQLYPRIAQGRMLAAGERCTLRLRFVPDDHRPHELPSVQLTATGEPGIGAIRLTPSRVPRYGRVDVICEVSGTWDNPFDPEQVALDAEVTDPAGLALTVPGFFWQDYEAVPPGPAAHALVPKGDSGWRIRFTPVHPGPHRLVPVLRNGGRTIRGPEATFECTRETAGHGFIRRAETNPLYFRHDDGAPFFAVGANVALIHGDGLGATFDVYGRFAAAGVNLIRTWWCYGASDLGSWRTGAPGEMFGGLRLDNAWRIDRLVDEADRLGLHLMCCLETQQNLRRDKTWQQFTYNRVNGGPVDEPREFFTDETARKAFRDRLRYVVARWGYSPRVFSWQFWNEVNACNQFEVQAVAAWHGEMARALRAVDPWGHLIHTNFGNMDGYPQIDALAEMEVVSSNIYSRRDMGQTARWAGEYLVPRYGKPYLLTEFGVGHRGNWVREDPEGILVHNGLWGSLVSGSAGTAMPWGCYNWIDPQDLYRYWRPLTALIEGIPFHARAWRPLVVHAFTGPAAEAPPTYGSVLVEGWPRNYSYTLCGAPPECHRIEADGRVPRADSLRGELRPGQEQCFAMDCPVSGDVIVHVPEIGSDGVPVLQLAIDGRTVIDKPLTPHGEDPWSHWSAHTAPIAAGEHRIAIRNAGKTSLWPVLELTRFLRRDGPDLEVRGIGSDDTILLWLRSPFLTWLHRREGRSITLQPEGELLLGVQADGLYQGTWIDTLTGTTIGTAQGTARAGRLRLRTPPVRCSAAVRLQRRNP